MILVLAACSAFDDGEMADRELAMHNHYAGVQEAIEAIRAEDERRFQQSMKAILKAGEVPGIRYPADLKAVQEQSQKLKSEKTWERRRRGLARMLSYCAGCHEVNDIPVPQHTQTTPDPLLRAVLWEDAGIWTSACKEIGENACKATTWKQRRLVLSEP